MTKRQGNNPKRRLVPRDQIDPGFLQRLADEIRYTGSALHKRSIADYGFHPPSNPRPNKSLCDGSGRTMPLAEAGDLFREGIKRGMVSIIGHDGLPKYIWAVDSEGHVCESKRQQGSRNYHGYELSEDDNDMRCLVLGEWGLRCKAN